MRQKILAVLIVIGLTAPLAWAQEDQDFYGPAQGDWEFTLSGTGSADHNFNDGTFGVNASIGYYVFEVLQINVRQDIDIAGSSTSGSTRIGVDYVFDFDRFRPFVGANIGGVYGNDNSGVDDDFIASLEGGLKYYVKPKTFVFGQLEYQWLTEESFTDDGRFVYSLGIGFNF